MVTTKAEVGPNCSAASAGASTFTPSISVPHSASRLSAKASGSMPAARRPVTVRFPNPPAPKSTMRSDRSPAAAVNVVCSRRRAASIDSESNTSSACTASSVGLLTGFSSFVVRQVPGQLLTVEQWREILNGARSHAAVGQRLTHLHRLTELVRRRGDLADDRPGLGSRRPSGSWGASAYGHRPRCTACRRPPRSCPRAEGSCHLTHQRRPVARTTAAARRGWRRSPHWRGRGS